MTRNILAGLVALLLVVFAYDALAQTMSSGACTGGPGACVTVDPGDTTDLAVGLPTGATYYVVFNADTTAAVDTGSLTVIIYGPCASTPASTSTCQKLYVDEDLLGGLAANALTGDCSVGLCRRHGLPGGEYWIDLVGTPAAGEIGTINFVKEK